MYIFLIVQENRNQITEYIFYNSCKAVRYMHEATEARNKSGNNGNFKTITWT
jgi:hypothetical protein